MPPTIDSDSSVPRDFRTTHWSVVLAAKRSDSPERMAALTALCKDYWYPLYAFVRRQGRDRHQAEDLTQGFFARLLEKNALGSVQRDQGRFRSFLLASLKNFLVNEWNRDHTVKRGGEYSIISWEDQPGEDRYVREPSHDATPERLFEQSWALTLIQTVLEQLKKEYADGGKSPLFEAIQAYLSEEAGAGTYAEIAAKLDMTEGAVKMSVFRMRSRFGILLRAQIAETVREEREVEEELRHLFSCVGN
jgi:RNA polymerase sigma-70 factor (ECF subfamily)